MEPELKSRTWCKDFMIFLDVSKIHIALNDYAPKYGFSLKQRVLFHVPEKMMILLHLWKKTHLFLLPLWCVLNCIYMKKYLFFIACCLF